MAKSKLPRSRRVSRARRAARGDRRPTKAEQQRARRELEEQRALPPEPGDPELAEFLGNIISRLRYAEDVALTVAGALRDENTTESLAAAKLLQHACANEITEQVGELEIALDCTSMAGSKLVINSNLKAKRARDTATGREGPETPWRLNV